MAEEEAKISVFIVDAVVVPESLTKMRRPAAASGPRPRLRPELRIARNSIARVLIECIGSLTLLTSN